jgi:acetylornithine deacetylase
MIAFVGRTDESLSLQLARLALEMKEILRQSIHFQSVSGQESSFVEFLADWARHKGLESKLWHAREEDLAAYPEVRTRHIPLAGRPTLVIGLPGHDDHRSLLLNAHSDVVSAPNPERWSHDPWEASERDGKVFGRGACDVKGPLVSALWAMLAIKDTSNSTTSGRVLLEIVPGEEDCVGLGTLTSVARGIRADGLVVLEPTENHPRCASRSGCRFDISCVGKSVHGTVKWLGRDAIRLMRCVLDCLDIIQNRWNDRSADPLFDGYPIARPITLDSLNGGDWQGMICDRCTAGGYLELLPGDPMESWKMRFRDDLAEEISRRGQDPGEVTVEFSEEYTGCRIAVDHPLCRSAEAAVGSAFDGWVGFNSGCEAGVRTRLHGTPTLVWGPGSLEQAHAVDEYVSFGDVELVAGYLAKLAREWTAMPLTKGLS